MTSSEALAWAKNPTYQESPSEHHSIMRSDMPFPSQPYARDIFDPNFYFRRLGPSAETLVDNYWKDCGLIFGMS
jgi:hypothetical protein